MAQSVAAGSLTRLAADPVDNINAEFLAHMTSVLNYVQQHEVFRPIVIPEDQHRQAMHSKGPGQPHFNMEAYTFDLTHATCKHTCISSEWNLSPFFTMHGGVPYNEKYIQELKNTCFREPALYVGVVVVAVDDPTVDPMTTAGKWERLSPEEPFFARLLAIKAAIDQGA